jgi:hypothetical protein
VNEPIFIFSMPRSGSTLLQGLLATHVDLCTHPEPWFLLPLASMHDYKNIQADYGYKSAQIAIKDLIVSMPGGEDEYYRFLKIFSNNLYGELSTNNCKNFIDKTPRYFYIIDFINKLYPNAKFIFLTRDIKDIFASYISTFNHGSLKRFDVYDKDFINGPNLIEKAIEKYKDKSFVVRYENLVNSPEIELKKIGKFLEIDKNGFDIESAFINRRFLSMGDKKFCNTKAIIKYKPKWRGVVFTTERKRILRSILMHLNPETILLFSNNTKESELSIISNAKTSLISVDIFHFYIILLARFLKKIATAITGYKDFS